MASPNARPETTVQNAAPDASILPPLNANNASANDSDDENDNASIDLLILIDADTDLLL